MVKVAAQWPLAVVLAQDFRRMLEIERGADRRRAIDEIVAGNDISRKPAEEQQGFIGLDVPRVDSDDQMPRLLSSTFWRWVFL
jgi:hypothetical protein